MRLVTALGFALLAGSVPLAAQQSSAAGTAAPPAAQQSYGVVGQFGPATSAQKQYRPEYVPNCPVVLNVSHLADGSMIRANRAHPGGIGQWLHIVVMTPTVSTATLLVRGYSDKGRITQTSGNGGPDAERTVTVTFAGKPNGQAIGNVWAPGLTAVDSIYLVSLTYVGGTNWSSPNQSACQVTPDPLMLISGT